MPPHPALPLSDLRVLVVEDEWAIACAAASALEALGAEIVGPVGSGRLGQFETLIWRERTLDGAVLGVQFGAEQVYPLADALIARGVPLLLATGQRVDRLPERFRVLPRVGEVLPGCELGWAAVRAFGRRAGEDAGPAASPSNQHYGDPPSRPTSLEIVALLTL